MCFLTEYWYNVCGHSRHITLTESCPDLDAYTGRCPEEATTVMVKVYRACPGCDYPTR